MSITAISMAVYDACMKGYNADYVAGVSDFLYCADADKIAALAIDAPLAWLKGYSDAKIAWARTCRRYNVAPYVDRRYLDRKRREKSDAWLDKSASTELYQSAAIARE